MSAANEIVSCLSTEAATEDYAPVYDDSWSSVPLLAQEDLYRLGNASGPRLDNVRPGDVATYERNGVVFVQATGKGISLLTEEAATRRPGWLWRIPKSTPLSQGLALHHNTAGHYYLCPTSDMTMAKYQALLLELAVRCERVRKQ